MLWYWAVDNLPKKLGRYQLIELLATGGMAHIYRARLETTGGVEKELVIKRVLPHLLDNREFLEMFTDEARITMPLNHGNIVQVFEFGQEGQDYFLAMEYVRGRNLEAVVTRLKELDRPMPIPVALFIASEVAKGLDYAHRFRDPHNRPTGIIHRDVSPQNVLVGFQGEVKLTDFGIAKARSKIHQTSQGIIRGKAVYLSPEQAECKEVDGRSDQFSLASVLFEMLTGTRPFEGDTEVATLQKVRQADVPPASDLRSEIPKELEQILAKALSLSPANRFDSCGAFQVALSRTLSQQSPEFTSASLAEWMRDLFSADITHEIEQRSVKDHLLDQLGLDPNRAKSKGLSTGEILQMGTVSMQSNKAVKHESRKSPTIMAATILAVLTISAMMAWYLFRPPPPLPEKLVPFSAERADADDSLDAGVRTPADKSIAMTNLPDTEDLRPDAGKDKADGNTKPDSHSSDGATRQDKASFAKADRKVAVQKWAILNINASPWAFVDIDGKRQEKETPLFKIKVSPGLHRLRFINPALKIDMVRTYRLRPGQTKTISVVLKEN